MEVSWKLVNNQKESFLSLPSVAVQLLGRVQLFVTPWTAACQEASLSFTISWSLLKFMSIELVMPSNHLVLCRPLLLLPSVSSSVRDFPNESVLHIRWPNYWSFSFSISPSSESSGLISFRIDWLALLAVQGTLKNLLQHHSSKASVLQHSAFFIIKLSNPYMTTGKTIPLTFFCKHLGFCCCFCSVEKVIIPVDFIFFLNSGIF